MGTLGRKQTCCRHDVRKLEKPKKLRRPRFPASPSEAVFFRGFLEKRASSHALRPWLAATSSLDCQHGDHYLGRSGRARLSSKTERPITRKRPSSSQTRSGPRRLGQRTGLLHDAVVAGSGSWARRAELVFPPGSTTRSAPPPRGCLSVDDRRVWSSGGRSSATHPLSKLGNRPSRSA